MLYKRKSQEVFEKGRKGNGNTAFVVTFFTGVFNRLRDSNSFSLGFFRGESGYFGGDSVCQVYSLGA